MLAIPPFCGGQLPFGIQCCQVPVLSVTFYWYSATPTTEGDPVPKQITEMLKGILEGLVLGILATRAAYGYEITAWLRDQGFTDIAEGTVYALLVRVEQRGLVDVEKVPSEKGPPRKVYSLNAAGREYLDEFWRTWSFLADRLTQLRQEGN
jgi:PadR family transcriptional regulator PadR